MEKNSFLEKARAAIKSAVGDDIPDYLKEQQKIKENNLEEKYKPTIMEVTENIETSNNEDSIDIRYQEQILKAIKSADLPGPDFFEFSEAVKKLKSSNSSMSLDDIIKNTYIVLSANGLSKNKILETGEHYINVLKTEKNKFEEAVQQGAKNKIEIPQSEIDELCKLNLELENQLNQIQEKINNNELLIKRKKEDIENTKQKLSLNKTKFNNTLNKIEKEMVELINHVKNINL